MINRTLGFLKKNSKTKTQQFEQLHISNPGPSPGRICFHCMEPFTQTYINKIEMAQRRAVCWVNSNCSTYASVSSMLNYLGWRSLEDRKADARLILFYKIVYNLFAVPLPQYINLLIRMTRHMHPLLFVQILATASYYKYSFFPLAIVLLHHIPVLLDLESFRSAVRTVPQCMP